MPLAALAGPVLSALLQHVAAGCWSYRIGFELLVYNALFVIAGLFLLSVGGKDADNVAEKS